MKILNIYQDTKAEDYKGGPVKHWAVPMSDIFDPYVQEFNLLMYERTNGYVSTNGIKEYQFVYIMGKKCYYVDIKDPIKCITESGGFEVFEYRERAQVLNYLFKCYYDQHHNKRKEVRTYFDFDPAEDSGRRENRLKAKVRFSIKDSEGNVIYERVEKFQEME